MNRTLTTTLPILAASCLLFCVQAASAQSAPSAEEKAIRDTAQAFVTAFNAADAPAVVALFTDDAEVLLDQGEPIIGKEAIQTRFAESFANAAEKAMISLETASIRFLSADVAVEEGTSTLTRPGDPATSEKSRYTVVYVKREGKWLQSIVRDASLDSVTPYDRLKELEWMVGDWVDESEAGQVQTTCYWADNKAFLVRDFKVMVEGKPVMTGSQRVGWDPLAGQIKSWVFDSEGGHAEGYWAREGNSWVIKSSGVLQDGSIVTATNVISKLDENTLTWASVDRTVGGNIAADLDPIKVVRKAPAPAPAR